MISDQYKSLSASFNSFFNRVISGFRLEVDENCALLGYYAASSGNFFPTFQDKL
jgi:hypothetical protein